MNHNGFCLLRLRLNLVLSVWCWCKYKKLCSGWRHVRRLASLSCRSAVRFWIKEQSPHSFNISGNTLEEDGTVLREDESGCEEEKNSYLGQSQREEGKVILFTLAPKSFLFFSFPDQTNVVKKKDIILHGDPKNSQSFHSFKKECTLHDNLSDFQPNYPPPNQEQQKTSYLVVLKIICRFSWGGRFVKSDFNPPCSARKMTYVVRFMSNVVRADVDCNAREYKESTQIHAQHTRERERGYRQMCQ